MGRRPPPLVPARLPLLVEREPLLAKGLVLGVGVERSGLLLPLDGPPEVTRLGVGSGQRPQEDGVLPSAQLAGTGGRPDNLAAVTQPGVRAGCGEPPDAVQG